MLGQEQEQAGDAICELRMEFQAIPSCQLQFHLLAVPSDFTKVEQLKGPHFTGQ